MYGGPQQGAFIDTIVNLTGAYTPNFLRACRIFKLLVGISHFKDTNGGTPNCVSITPLVSYAVPFSFHQL
jgi:hypothetical protein